MSGTSAEGSEAKRKKEIYTYTAPWTIYGMHWSARPTHKFRLALGSFVEEYNNKVRRRRRQKKTKKNKKKKKKKTCTVSCATLNRRIAIFVCVCVCLCVFMCVCVCV
jgi:hypothetical protein